MLVQVPSLAFGQNARQAPGSLTAAEIAGHRLTDGELEGFGRASRRLVSASRRDGGGTPAPLFTRDIVMLEDVAVAAATLERRLAGNPALAAELAQENVPPREYVRFALALIGARLAQGFLSAGVLKRVPEGVAADNVAFISRRQADVDALLEELDVDWNPSGPPR